MSVIEPVRRRPLSAEAKDKLRAYINSSDLGENKKLPTEDELAQLLDVSRITIRRALSELEQEGLILRMHGRGTFVNPIAANLKVNLALMMEFGTVIEQNGYHSEYKLEHLLSEPADDSIARALQLNRGDRVIRVDKLHYADKTPVIVSLGRIPAALFKEEPTQQEWDKDLNFEIIQRYTGHIVIRDFVEFTSITAGQAEKIVGRSLPLQAEAFLMMQAVGYDKNNLPIIHGIALYDTSRLQVGMLRTAPI